MQNGHLVYSHEWLITIQFFEQTSMSVFENPFDRRMASPSRLESLIDQACHTDSGQMNLGLNMEICDLINEKQKHYPREASTALLRIINGRNPQASLNALTLLDHLVKNCGYPLQLIISTKEFSKRTRPSDLGVNQQWNATICVSSRYKDDFRHITDMYRLLSYKGYHFPGLSTEAAAVLAPRETLQTEEELEEQDRIAQGAKLQELLRMGTPAALEQANELMKVMAGYDLERKRDYKKEVNEELTRIEARILQFNEKLVGKKADDRWVHDNTLEELYAFTNSSQGRIQKLIQDGDEEERTERLLHLNDLINQVIEKYRQYKDGKPINKEPVTSPTNSEASTKSAPTKSSAQPISLIDFDDGPAGAISLPLSGMAISPGAASFGSFETQSKTTSPVANVAAVAPKNDLDDLFGLFPSAGNTAPVIAQGLMGTTAPPLVTSQMATADFGNFGMMSPPLVQQPKQQDPLGDLGFFSQPVAAPPKAVEPSAPVDFFKKNGLQIKAILKESAQNVEADLTFINTTPVPFTHLTFQVAVPKAMQLKLNPLSGTVIQPLNQAQVKQSLIIANATKATVKMKFKVAYQVNGAEVEESGDYPLN
ncbi:hypothetical protein BC829DRAFT_382317 [Chytridium lagenaria]|nr:hypothetical protein BC829DRAFT_382317 [Chytridium lagenaria]